MMEIYSVESRKGGVGKTTIALNLAKALVKKDYDVLVIDCDITGTPITNAAIHSEYWKNDVVVSSHGKHPIKDDYLGCWGVATFASNTKSHDDFPVEIQIKMDLDLLVKHLYSL